MSSDSQSDIRAAGARIYQSLTDAQREHLQSVLINGGIGSLDTKSSWRESVENMVMESLRRKLSSGESADDLDVASLVDELMPSAHAAIPAAIRQQLFEAVLNVTSLQ